MSREVNARTPEAVFAVLMQAGVIDMGFYVARWDRGDDWCNFDTVTNTLDRIHRWDRIGFDTPNKRHFVVHLARDF